MAGERLLTVAEAANRLGVSPATVKRRAAESGLSFPRPGRAIMFTEGDLIALIEATRCRSNLSLPASERATASGSSVARLPAGYKRGYGGGWAVSCSVTPENPGREPKPGELIGVRKEVRKYTVRETVG